MYLILVFLPLIGFLNAGLFGRKIGPQGASILTVNCLVLTFFLSLFAFRGNNDFACGWQFQGSSWAVSMFIYHTAQL